MQGASTAVCCISGEVRWGIMSSAILEVEDELVRCAGSRDAEVGEGRWVRAGARVGRHAKNSVPGRARGWVLRPEVPVAKLGIQRCMVYVSLEK